MKYSMKGPDGKTYSIEGPEGAPDKKVKARIMAQYKSASKPGRMRRAVAGLGQLGLPVAGAVLGGEAGGALGAMGGFAAPVTIPAGAISGSGAGAAGGQKLADQLNKLLGVPQPPTATKLFGIPLPKNRYVQAGVLGGLAEAPGQGLGIAARSPMGQRAIGRYAPKLFEKALDIPVKDTEMMMKAGPHKAEKALEFLRGGGYKRAAAKAGLPDAEEQAVELANRSAQGKEVSEGVEPGIIEAFKNVIKNPRSTPAQKASAEKTMRDLATKNMTYVDPLKPMALQQAGAVLRSLKQIVDDPFLLEQAGPSRVANELIKFRKNMADWVSWQAEEHADVAVKNVQKARNLYGKQFYRMTNDLIEKIPRIGKVIRSADATQQLGHSAEMFQGAFKSPSYRTKGGIAKWGGLGIGPFIISRATGLPPLATYAAAIASRSPALARKLLFAGKETPKLSAQILPLLSTFAEKSPAMATHVALDKMKEEPKERKPKRLVSDVLARERKRREATELQQAQ